MYSQVWLDDQRLLNFWVNNQFSHQLNNLTYQLTIDGHKKPFTWHNASAKMPKISESHNTAKATPSNGSKSISNYGSVLQQPTLHIYVYC
jgi:hypothetical protein